MEKRINSIKRGEIMNWLEKLFGPKSLRGLDQDVLMKEKRTLEHEERKHQFRLKNLFGDPVSTITIINLNQTTNKRCNNVIQSQ